MFIYNLNVFARKVRENVFLRNMQSFLSGRFVLAATTLVIGVITARLLTPENRGLYTLFFTLSGLIVTLFHVGISPANIYFLNEKKRDALELLGNTLMFVGLSSMVLGVMFIASIIFDFRGPFSNIDPRITWSLMLVVVLGTLVETSVSGLVYASNLYSFISRTLIFQSALLLLSTGPIYFFTDELAYILAFRVLAVSIFIAYFMYGFMKYMNFERLRISCSTLKAQIKFGSKNWFQNIISFLNVRSYILILGYMAEPKVVGFFSVAWLFIEVMRFLPDTVATMILPSLAGETSDEARTQLAVKSVRLICLGTGLIGIMLLLTLGVAIPLVFGEDYTASIDIARILISGAVFGTVYQVLSRYFTSVAQQKYSVIASLWGLSVGLLGSVILISLYGGVGAAYAFGVSSIVTATIVLYYFCVITDTSLTEVVKIKREDFSFN